MQYIHTDVSHHAIKPIASLNYILYYNNGVIVTEIIFIADDDDDDDDDGEEDDVSSASVACNHITKHNRKIPRQHVALTRHFTE